MARKKKQTEDLPQENVDNSDDTFGLPEIEYEPLKREVPPEEIVNEEPEIQQPEPIFAQEEQPSELPLEEPKREEVVEDNQFYEPSYSYADQDEEKPAIWPKVLGILLLLIVAGGAIWYFAQIRPKQLAKEAKERREQLAIQEEAQKKEDERLAEQQRLEDEQKKAAAVATATPAAGSIQKLEGRTGRYYVVVASSVDGDLIMDYAQKLSKKGVTTKIIPPFGKSIFHRLAVAEGDTYANTQASADGMKGGEYGDKVWVIKY